MLDHEISLWRLRNLERECQRARNEATDPATRREFRQWEAIIRDRAEEIERTDRLLEPAPPVTPRPLRGIGRN